ncbi:MAG: BamA/TamA family outer membrane protein [Myxococcales bacterium]|nr:BamA/TamA family outer membrane protein [Myxococcales bacterium]
MVREVTFTGVNQVDDGAIRAVIATRETSRFPLQRPRWLRWWRWWWVEPEYFDEGALARDRLRIQRFYQARGFYNAEIASPAANTSGNQVDVRIAVTEGPPVLVSDVRIRGCEQNDPDPLPAWVCRNIVERLTLRAGQRFDEESFGTDRNIVQDFVRDAGFAAAVVVPRSVIDPVRNRAYLEYSVLPGERSRFGDVRLFVPPRDEPFQTGRLPNGLPVAPIFSALRIRRGEAYSRQRLSEAQQSLFDLGVFGIARIEEAPRADGFIDLNVRLSTARLWRFRLGGGFEADNTRNNLHLLVGYEHRNAFGGFRRARLEARPQLFFPSLFTLPDNVDLNPTPGLSALAELAQPEIFAHTTGILSANYDYGPDTINPQFAFRNSLRLGLGFERRFTPRVTASAFARFTRTTYSANELSATENEVLALANDPLYRQQYADQQYGHLEQSLSWDRRNSRTRPTRGFFINASLAESIRSPLSNYTFLRAMFDGRSFVSLSRNITVAFRGVFGIALGESRQVGDRWYWPAPPELRFFSGGSQSNRGYSFNRVGTLGTVPTVAQRDAMGVPTGPATDDLVRYIAIGGTAMWEASMELRWQPGSFGLVAFLDMSNVVGLNYPQFSNPTGVNGRCDVTPENPFPDEAQCVRDGVVPPLLPRPFQMSEIFWNNGASPLFSNFHPSVGLGVRYLTAVGPLRMDIGVRLNDLACNRTLNEIARQNGAVASQVPSYYVVSSPRCDFLSFSSIPATLHLTLGEAY